MKHDIGLTFDDVCLVPVYNNIASRSNPIVNSASFTEKITSIPIVASNMDSVIGLELAELLIKAGSVPIFHRFTSLNLQLDWFKAVNGNCFASCGINILDNDIKKLADNCKGICVDIAHGHSETVIQLVDRIKKIAPKTQVIAGNVCTPEGYVDLVNAGANAVKVGVGGGAACTTRMVTGFGVPQFTAIKLIADEKFRMHVPIIADGGIRNTRDFALAIAAGADTVMMGSLFAATFESAAEKSYIAKDNISVQTVPQRARYRGQASAEFQEDYYGGLKAGTVPEGVADWIPISGSANDLIDEYLGSLRSAMTYGGAITIEEFQRKAKFMRVTTNYLAESKPRI